MAFLLNFQRTKEPQTKAWEDCKPTKKSLTKAWEDYKPTKKSLTKAWETISKAPVFSNQHPKPNLAWQDLTRMYCCVWNLSIKTKDSKIRKINQKQKLVNNNVQINHTS